MTDQVNRVSGAKETSPGGTYSGGGFADGHKKKKSHVPEVDLVEISQAAKDRSSGKKSKGIIEYLKELLG